MTDPRAAAAAFAELFPAVYLRFHRRDAKRQPALPAASHAVLHHLSLTGPLTVGEMARHLDRAQSVVSEIADHLEAKGLLERMRDPRDKRRVLVWLTDDGLARLAREREVLERTLLERAMAAMTAPARAELLAGMRALVRAGDAPRPSASRAPRPSPSRTTPRKANR